MSDEYTPTTEGVRGHYFRSRWFDDPRFRYSQKAMTEFDRWYDAEIRAAKAEAWDEGYQEANQDLWRDGGREGNPYQKAVQPE